MRRLAIEAATGVPRLVDSKEPVCWLTGFGEFSLEYLLRFWIRDPQQGLVGIQGTVLLAIWDKLKANGISIPLPQREITMKAPRQAGTSGAG